MTGTLAAASIAAIAAWTAAAVYAGLSHRNRP